MDERTIDHALLDALSKADPGPYPKQIPYAATIRQFLPNPVTAFRWATYTAAGTIVLGGMALVVKAMGLDHQAPPQTRAMEAMEAMGALPEVRPEVRPDVSTQVSTEVDAPPVEMPEGRGATTSVAEAGPGAGAAREPVAMTVDSASGDAGKVSVVPLAYEPRHAAPDIGLDLLGMKVAVDLI